MKYTYVFECACGKQITLLYGNSMERRRKELKETVEAVKDQCRRFQAKRGNPLPLEYHEKICWRIKK